MRSQEIRTTFLNYFAKHGHQIVSSSPLVPINDKTLLFTNAGMVQFKETFLGDEIRPYNRATTAQKCVRAGGKHNDLENVGYTARHHTFFEMLGNFSFGDYFKEQAIYYCWELVTEYFKLPKEKLWVTVYEEDDEAYDIWTKKIGISKDRISRIGAKDNFWQMGDTGPCGPCSELFYDHGEHIWGGPPGTPEEDGDRFIEIWNLVFMQYDRQADGTLIPLPKPSVDTGMGLERIAAILQGVHSNYEIDIFVNLIKAAAIATNTNDLTNDSLKVISDHIRSISFLIVDGVIPSNEGRGYVLRRIIRRAIRHGYKLGQTDLFLYKLVEALIVEMGEAYPELKVNQIKIEERIKTEEQKFAKTLDDGMQLLEHDLAQLNDNTISGKTLFKLYDTYGFPVDLTCDIARERQLEVDLDGYEQEMQNQVDQSKKGGKFKSQTKLNTSQSTTFVGYEANTSQANILEIFIDQQSKESITGEGIIILDQTPFYAESGGQVGDTGTLKTDSGEFIVENTQKQGNTFLHYGYINQGSLEVGNSVITEINVGRRNSIKRNHSATHLLHAALRRILGNQVEQKGSLVTDERLRFDFTYEKPIEKEALKLIEAIANNDILENYPTKTEYMSQDAAIQKGAIALFGEKYGETVRVLEIGPNSTELCGGTHVNYTGEIGQIIITSEAGIAAGIRRIEAITGWAAIEYRRKQTETINEISQKIKATPEHLINKIEQVLNKQKELQARIKSLQKGLLVDGNASFEGSKHEVLGYTILTSHISKYNPKDLRSLASTVREKNNIDLVLIITEDDSQRVHLVVCTKKEVSEKLNAGKIINDIAKIVGGKGGGRADLAQAGGSLVDKIPDAIAAIDEVIKSYH